MLACVCPTHNWKAAYEDVGETRFYANLSQMPALPLVRYLCRHREEDPAYLRTAEELNRWVEDQFIAFGPDDEASPVRVKGPQVFEQFLCWRPMEGHTANWILALIELHRATGKRIYLDKAKAAANAICHEQYADGQFSTWGRDYQNGQGLRGRHGPAAQELVQRQRLRGLGALQADAVLQDAQQMNALRGRGTINYAGLCVTPLRIF